MTVIAWDGNILAADRQSQAGDCRKPVRKIFSHMVNLSERALIGISGDLTVGLEMLEWFKQGADPATFRSEWRNTQDGACLFVVRPDKTVWRYESSPYPFQYQDKFAASGSGDGYALVAMRCGCSSIDAVRHATRVSVSCGLGVDWLDLNGGSGSHPGLDNLLIDN